MAALNLDIPDADAVDAFDKASRPRRLLPGSSLFAASAGETSAGAPSRAAAPPAATAGAAAAHPQPNVQRYVRAPPPPALTFGAPAAPRAAAGTSSSASARRAGPPEPSLAAAFDELFAPIGEGSGGEAGGGVSGGSGGGGRAPPAAAANSRSAPASGVAAAPGAAPGGGGGSDARSTIFVSPTQRGNPILRYIKHVHWTEAAVECGGADFVMGKGVAAIFLSLRYHALHPGYLVRRLRELAKGGPGGAASAVSARLRVVLVQVDVSDPERLLLDVTMTAMGASATVVCAFSEAEAARYLETYKVYEHKSAR